MVNDKNLKRVAQQHSQNVANMFAMKKKKGNTSSSDSSSSTSEEFKSPSTSSVASTSEGFTSPSTPSVALTSEEFMSPSASQRNQFVTVSNQTFIKNMNKMNLRAQFSIHIRKGDLDRKSLKDNSKQIGTTRDLG